MCVCVSLSLSLSLSLSVCVCVCWDVEKPQSSSLDRSVFVSVVNFKAWGSELTLQFEGFVCVLLRWLTCEGMLSKRQTAILAGMFLNGAAPTEGLPEPRRQMPKVFSTTIL